MRWGTTVPIVALLGVAGQATAQAPGYQQIDVGSIMAEYKAEVLTHTNAGLAAWENAWANDRIDDLLGLYWEDAVLIPPEGTPRRGSAEIREYLVATLPDHGHIEAFMLDFDASGGMAQVYGNYLLGIQRGEAAGSQWSGPMITVYLRRGRTWKIRSQIFLPH